MYSVCCSHPSVLRAAMQVARHYDTVLLVEATSNQVDQFGGYTGMTPPQLSTTCTRLARSKASRWSGWCWAATTSARTPGKAGRRHRHAARRNLIAAYAAAGFHKIHLDCSMRCADDPQYLSDEVIAARSARLCIVAEQAAEQAGLPPPVYVIGTEVPIPGGEANLAQAGAVTSPQAARARWTCTARPSWSRTCTPPGAA
jgi:D-tagatose-1,6-bisphosphate aldolase subunit GatZ/KbaZ